jgi:hypothetical protein
MLLCWHLSYKPMICSLMNAWDDQKLGGSQLYQHILALAQEP